MLCVKCSQALPEDAVYCYKCGKKQPPSEPGEKKDYGYKRSYFTHNGIRYETTGKTQKEADRKATLKQAALESGEVGLSGKMSVSRWADEWLETYKANTVGDAHYKNYEMYLGIIKDSIGQKRLTDIKDTDLQKILNSRLINRKKNKHRSRSDLSKLRMTIKAIFKRARISRLISYDPSENLELPAAKKGKRRSITDAERESILTLAKTHYSGPWIKMILYCGLRPGETRALDWRHIDFDKKIIHVSQAMKSHSAVIGAPKTEAGIRDIPIPDVYIKDLAEMVAGPFDPVFTQPTTGKRHTEESMRCLWENFKRELDIMCGAELKRNEIIVSAIAGDLVPYCLRHTYGTDLQNAGVPINVAKYLMGHGDISVTANIYTHTTEEVIGEASKKANEYHGKTENTLKKSM